MPRLPHGNPAIASLNRSVFSSLESRLAAHDGPVFPLHVGDTYLRPPPGAWLEEQTFARAPELNRYTSPKGSRELIAAACATRSARDGYEVEPANVLPVVGATGGLAAAVRALLAPGQEILLPGPHWPLIRGMSVAHGLVPVTVPFYDRATDAASARALLEGAITPATGAIYLNSPNNPSGLVLGAEALGAVVELAIAHDLWILVDEVYESLAFVDSVPRLTDFPEARERTVFVHSFSKAFGMAGFRVGYAVADPAVIERLEKLTTYLVYSVPSGGQRAAAQALLHGDAWLAETRAAYRRTGAAAARRLGVSEPAGGTFLFFDAAAALDDRGMMGFLEDCLGDGLLVAPGSIFGADYATYVRVCFTSIAPDGVATGIEILARRLGR